MVIAAKDNNGLKMLNIMRFSVDNAAESVFWIGPDARFIYVNKAACKSLGYTRYELLNMKVHDIAPEFPQESWQEHWQYLKEQGSFTSESVYKAKNGNTFPVEILGSFLFFENQEYYITFARDITEHKLFEEALMASEKYFRSFVESSHDCISNISLEGAYISINSAGCILNDIDRKEDMVGHSCMKHVVENQKDMQEAIEKAAKGEGASVQFRSITGKGREIWWDSKFTPVKDFDGRVKSILQVARDISEYKEMEKSLLVARDIQTKEHDKLNAIFKQVEAAKREWEKTMDCVGDIVILTDAEGRIKRFNKALLQLTNKSFTELIGRAWDDVMGENGLETVTFFAGSVELFQAHAQRWFTLTSYTVKEDSPDNAGSVITLHETTEVKRIAERLELTNKEIEGAYSELKNTQAQILQQEKMASIGQLAAGVAHEINNPMGFITSNLGTLDKYIKKLSDYIAAQAEALASLDSPEVLEQLKEMRRKTKLDYVLEDIGKLIEESQEGADRVKNIVQNLKTFSRVDQAEYKDADINDCIESTLNIVWNELKYKATVKKEYGELPLIKCFPQQLNQAFMNVLVNAAQAIEKQGDIRIRTWHENGAINVAISDTGSGIPEDKIKNIFDPFFTTKPVGKGTGLGLSISYDIVKKHNGEIIVESEVGKGTTFCIRIPVVENRHDG